MPVSINGNTGVITGLAVGGLPDGTVDADSLASNAVTAGKLASGVGGKILAVSEAIKKDTFSTQSTSFTDITGLSVTMTPASTSSKFLINYTVNFSPRDQHYSGAIRCVKVVGGTTTDDIYIGDAASNRVRCSSWSFSNNTSQSRASFRPLTGSFLHSPSTTSAVTFKMQCMLLGTYGWANDVFVNRTNTWSDSNAYGSCPSGITVTELAS